MPQLRAPAASLADTKLGVQSENYKWFPNGYSDKVWAVAMPDRAQQPWNRRLNENWLFLEVKQTNGNNTRCGRRTRRSTTLRRSTSLSC